MMTPRDLTYFKVDDIFWSVSQYGNNVFKVLEIIDTEDIFELKVMNLSSNTETTLGYSKEYGPGGMNTDEYYLLARN